MQENSTTTILYNTPNYQDINFSGTESKTMSCFQIDLESKKHQITSLEVDNLPLDVSFGEAMTDNIEEFQGVIITSPFTNDVLENVPTGSNSMDCETIQSVNDLQARSFDDLIITIDKKVEILPSIDISEKKLSFQNNIEEHANNLIVKDNNFLIESENNDLNSKGDESKESVINKLSSYLKKSSKSCEVKKTEKSTYSHLTSPQSKLFVPKLTMPTHYKNLKKEYLDLVSDEKNLKKKSRKQRKITK